MSDGFKVFDSVVSSTDRLGKGCKTHVEELGLVGRWQLPGGMSRLVERSVEKGNLEKYLHAMNGDLLRMCFRLGLATWARTLADLFLLKAID